MSIKNRIGDAIRRGIKALPARYRWSPHRIIAIPLMEICDLLEREELGDWIDDAFNPPEADDEELRSATDSLLEHFDSETVHNTPFDWPAYRSTTAGEQAHKADMLLLGLRQSQAIGMGGAKVHHFPFPARVELDKDNLPEGMELFTIKEFFESRGMTATEVSTIHDETHIIVDKRGTDAPEQELLDALVKHLGNGLVRRRGTLAEGAAKFCEPQKEPEPEEMLGEGGILGRARRLSEQKTHPTFKHLRIPRGPYPVQSGSSDLLVAAVTKMTSEPNHNNDETKEDDKS